jgi:glycogen debranching enzyme
MSPHVRAELWELGLRTIEGLETDKGILASGKEEVYGCIFGRDSLISAMSLLRAYDASHHLYFLSLVSKILLNLASLQGKEHNIESGEEPGKIIHEYRPEGHEHLTEAPQGERAEKPWYLYPDGVMRNFDSIDATPLFLMTAYEYYRLSKDEVFIRNLLPHVRSALRWLLEYGDSNQDGLIDYQFSSSRTFGGLKTQSWMDSTESVFFEDTTVLPSYPLAPVEAQAYAYASLRSWGGYFAASEPAFAQELLERATRLKVLFNEKFLINKEGSVSLAFASDGEGRQLTSARSSMGHVLWACPKDNTRSLGEPNDARSVGEPDCILNKEYIPLIIERLLAPDLYVLGAGIRTLSSYSCQFEPNSYHNGSIWPHDTALVAEGFENFGYKKEAWIVRSSLLGAYEHFKTPLELFTYTDGQFGEYVGPSGQGACRTQAWSAASLLAMLGKVSEAA